jgi:acyl-CoA thioesterase-1
MGLEDRSRAFPARVGSLADSAGIPVEVVNAGVEGDTSAGGLRRLEWALADGADVLVLELGANDGLRGLDPGAMEENLERIIARARELHPGIEIVLAGMEAPPNLGADYTRTFRRVFPRLARSEDVTLVPFLLEGVAGVSSRNQADGIHPNGEGHRHIAEEVLWPVLAPVLRSAARAEDARVSTVPPRGSAPAPSGVTAWGGTGPGTRVAA